MVATNSGLLRPEASVAWRVLRRGAAAAAGWFERKPGSGASGVNIPLAINLDRYCPSVSDHSCPDHTYLTVPSGQDDWSLKARPAVKDR